MPANIKARLRRRCRPIPRGLSPPRAIAVRQQQPSLRRGWAYGEEDFARRIGEPPRGPPGIRTSLARQLRGRGVENPGPRNLGGDQEGRNNRGHADKSQELIHRKHDCRPPKRFQFVVCVVRSSRVRIWSEITAPDIVSSARIVMTAIVLMGVIVASDCGRKCQSLAHFQDQAAKQSWPRRANSPGRPYGQRRRSPA